MIQIQMYKLWETAMQKRDGYVGLDEGSFLNLADFAIDNILHATQDTN